MKRIVITFAAATLSFLASAQQEVVFPDPVLDAAVRAELDIPEGVPILDTDLVGVGFTELPHTGDISSLEGLQFSTDLRIIDLSFGEISDLSPLESLTNLEFLRLRDNLISDLSPLQGLANLVELDLRENQIRELAPLGGLNNLEQLLLRKNLVSDLRGLEEMPLKLLHLGDNRINDITPLATLSELYFLDLGFNFISDLSSIPVLSNLSYEGEEIPLTFLDLSYNRINNISPLVANSVLDDASALSIQCNPLSDDALLIDLPELEARGVSVQNEGICNLEDLIFGQCSASAIGGQFRAAPFASWKGDGLLILLALLALTAYRPRAAMAGKAS